MNRELLSLHEEASNEIDCLQCGNCCRHLGPRILERDIDTLAKALRIKPAAFIDAYLRIDEDRDWVFSAESCPFLGEDNYCAVYKDRPKACRDYPHTDRKKFHQIYALSVKNASFCPIVFRVLEQLKGL
ncbi:MAG TPA: YkgJ family cysteine cluster protein [Porphyromonadaceae bacterium]|nr:YkgJ family cysteine cluster protein [Porphyromonadaceae bacterium]HBK30643.1 YkgJ family cysteine cluster protein [Porphyromonadaceae bacterium]HBL34167.1 YkgJ family cysteine cluster protein [Porphyromonadaceae bacterium]HBX46198.1 YkgJ family cysteine cluster protein [Porphyromonadaceae bacterium]HCM19862.1 YkgJ family cysteine cluster protein [Porphyromonadaceae bacterium]